ncbi:MAG: PIN domain-containing protein [Chloroflexota bacterium]|nr:PIN domain-containing protein [Chloroflexota bacterium]
MPLRFLDTNVLLRYLTRDDERKATAAFALLQRIERGEERVVTTQAVIFETVFTLQRFYKVPRPEVQALVLPIIMLRGVQLPNKPLYQEAFSLYAAQKISLPDAWNAVFMRARGLTEIYSWDTDFDEMDWLTRIEPR